jgi:methyl-accepting chemotaxis protein
MSTGRRLKSRYYLDLILKIYFAIIAAMITSSLLNYWLVAYLKWNPILSHLCALTVGGLTTVLAVFHLARRDNRPGEEIKRGLKMMGEGNLSQLVRLNRTDMMAEIAESMNRANQELSGRLRSVIRNLARLAQVEEELSSQLKERRVNDQYTRNLVYMMKISTSRIKNDLESFSLEDEKIADNQAK